MKDEDIIKITQLMNLYEASLRCYALLSDHYRYGKMNHRVDLICDDLIKQIEALMLNDEDKIPENKRVDDMYQELITVFDSMTTACHLILAKDTESEEWEWNDSRKLIDKLEDLKDILIDNTKYGDDPCDRT